MRNRAGSLLIVSLWLVTILSVLAVAIARHLSLEVRMTKYRLAREQAKELARSGVFLAMQRLAKDIQTPEADGKNYDWLGDEWAVFPQEDHNADPSVWVVPFPAPGHPVDRFSGSMRIRVIDEGRKLHLNQAITAQLARLVKDEALAQTMMDARDEPDPSEDRSADAVPYFAKNGPIIALEELNDLPGMTQETYAVLAANATPYHAAEPVNINTATSETLKALGLSDATVQLILHYRDGPDGPIEHEQDGFFTEAGQNIINILKDHEGVDLTGTPDGNLLLTGALGVTSDMFTINSEAIIQDPVIRVRLEVVVRRAGCGDGVPSPCIMAWRER